MATLIHQAKNKLSASKQDWFGLKKVLHGMFLGMSIFPPGTCLATTSVILGIYEKFVTAVADLMSPRWKKGLLFLLPYGIGIIVASIFTTNAIAWAMENHANTANFFFLGLVMAALPWQFHAANKTHHFQTKHFAILLGVATLVAMMVFLPTSEQIIVTEMTPFHIFMIMITGVIMTGSLVVPGFSGTLLMLVIGTYTIFVTAFTNFNGQVVLFLLIGAAIGMVTCVNAIKYLFAKFPAWSYAVTIGMVLGSIFLVYPGLPPTLGELAVSLSAWAVGVAIITLTNIRKYQLVKKGKLEKPLPKLDVPVTYTRSFCNKEGKVVEVKMTLRQPLPLKSN